MVVQHNLRAMNSNRMLGLTASVQSKSTEKLSSGYKINRAADDAAGLSISEKMRKQIRGLTQASLNAADGISAVQTAEGALNEVQDMLQRMNELAVKAANGTMSDDDRNYIQDEISQLETEINRVATTTKFNETYLLKGDDNAEKTAVYSYKMIDVPASFEAIDPSAEFYAAGETDTLAETDIISILESGGKIYSDTVQAQASSDSADLTWKDSMGQSVTINLTGWKANDSIVIGTDTFDYDGSSADSTTAGIAATIEGTISDSYDVSYNTGSGEITITAKAAATDLDAALTTIRVDGSNITAATDVADSVAAGVYNASDSLIPYDSVFYAEGGTEVLTAAEVQAALDKGAPDTLYTVAATQPEAADTEYTFTDSSREMAALYDSTGKAVKASELAEMADSVVLYTDSEATDSVSMADISAYTESTEVNGALELNLHVGADSTDDNKIGLEIKSMSAAALGIMNLDVTTEEKATEAIDVIANALQQVSTQRSALGAVQNRLEHTIANLDNVVENTTAAESQIRDTDMATEMVKFSNNNILAQAGQAMLAQANQANQGVLSLLG